MEDGFLEIFSAFRDDILTLNKNLEEIQMTLNKLIDEHNSVVKNLENCERGFELNNVRLNKMELIITKLQQQLPKIRSFDYLPIPKVNSGSKL